MKAAGEADEAATKADLEIHQEMFRQAKAALETQRTSAERLRTRITAASQQATTLAAAGATGWAALFQASAAHSMFSAGVLAAEVLWLAAALRGLQKLLPKAWAEAAMKPDDFAANANPAGQPLPRVYQSMAESFGSRFAFNKQRTDDLTIAANEVLLLLICAPLTAIAVMLVSYWRSASFHEANSAAAVAGAGVVLVVLGAARHLIGKALRPKRSD